MGHTLKERIDMMLERMSIHYGPHRVRRMSKEEIDKINEKKRFSNGRSGGSR